MAQERLTEEKDYYETNLVAAALSDNRKDLFKQYYEEQATSDKDNAIDTFRNWLIEQGETASNLTDKWYQYLQGQGYTGQLHDMERQFYIDNS